MNLGLLEPVAQLKDINPYRTDDLDAARWHISNLFVPHQLDIVGPHQVLDVCISHARLQGVSLVYHRHGAKVRVRPEKLKEFFLLQIPLRGEASARIDNQEVYCNPNQALMLSPTSGIDMKFGQDCEQFIVRIERPNLERHLEQALGRQIESPLAFAPAVPLTTSGAREIVELLRFMTMSLADGKGISSSSIARGHMVSLLLSGLLTNLAHNYRDELSQGTECPTPTCIRKAQQYIRRNLAEQIGPDDIARAAQISTRALFATFRIHLNTTPMQYVKDLRLELVRRTLAASTAQQTSVTTVAMECGFHHLGHFSAAYKAKVGELPHETLCRENTAEPQQELTTTEQ